MTALPPPCDPEMFVHGTVIAIFHAPAHPTEAWVRKVAAFSGERVDWHYVAGYAIVRYIGNRRRVLRTIELLRGELECERFRIVPEETSLSGRIHTFWNNLVEQLKS